MTVRSRGEFIDLYDTVQLKVQFYNGDGYAADTDAIPTVSIVNPYGVVAIAPTSTGVYKLDTGLYAFEFTIGATGPFGVWTDVWQGSVGGVVVSAEKNFVVAATDLPSINSDGYIHLGDDPGFDYSQEATKNINKLLKALKARLNSSGKKLAKDQYGNDVEISCDIFSVEVLTTLLGMSLSWFNSVPHFTIFSFDDTWAIDQWFQIIVQGATILALSSQSLLEKGAEFSITDDGISFNPAPMGELLNSQAGTEMTNYTEMVKLIKENLKPNPIGLGTITFGVARNPYYSRLRWRRERQII